MRFSVLDPFSSYFCLSRELIVALFVAFGPPLPAGVSPPLDGFSRFVFFFVFVATRSGYDAAAFRGAQFSLFFFHFLPVSSRFLLLLPVFSFLPPISFLRNLTGNVAI